VRTALLNAALVGSGGFVGALARYGLGGLVQRQVPFSTFPYGTLAVNMLGCFGIGVLSGLADARQVFGPEARLFVFIGVLGAFTTFSTFGFETFAMLRDAEYARAAGNVGTQVVLGLTLVWIGYTVATVTR
jgi:CrcB protein